MATQQLQENLYDKKSLFTLSGSAGAVWLLCLVMANLDQEHQMLSVSVYKFVALGLSMVLAVYMVLRDKRKTRKENYLFAFFNGLLIFVNASGINAISSNVAKLASEPSQDSAWVTTTTQSYEAQFLAFSFFVNDVDWWPNAKKEAEINDLKAKLKAYEQELATQNDIPQKQETIPQDNTAQNANYEQQIAALKQELERCVTRAERQIGALTDQLEECKKSLEAIENTGVNPNRNQTNPRLTQELENCKKSLEGITNSYNTVAEAYGSLKARLEECEGKKRGE